MKPQKPPPTVRPAHRFVLLLIAALTVATFIFGVLQLVGFRLDAR